MSRYSWIDIFLWAAMAFNAGYALHAWFKLKNKPQAMISGGLALALSRPIPLVITGLVLMVYGMTRGGLPRTSSPEIERENPRTSSDSQA